MISNGTRGAGTHVVFHSMHARCRDVGSTQCFLASLVPAVGDCQWPGIDLCACVDNKNKKYRRDQKGNVWVCARVIGKNFDKQLVMNVDFQVHMSSCIVLVKSEAHEGVGKQGPVCISTSKPSCFFLSVLRSYPIQNLFAGSFFLGKTTRPQINPFFSGELVWPISTQTIEPFPPNNGTDPK